MDSKMKGTLYALTRTKEDIDDSERFKLMLTEVGATGAVVIDGANIAADTIYTRHLRADSIRANHIKAGEITTDHITAGTINADRLTANTITSNMIHTNGLDAGVIKTGLITAGTGVSVLNMANGEFSLAGGKLGYVAATDRLYIGASSLFLGEVPIEEHNRMVGNRDTATTRKATVENEKKEIDAAYTAIYNDANLIVGPKATLLAAYSNVSTGYTAYYGTLITALDAVIAAPLSTTIAAFATLQATATTATTNYGTSLATFTTALNVARKSIEDKAAQDKATLAQTTAVSSAATATTAAITADKQIKDTRTTNENPSWYWTTYPRQTAEEFKIANNISSPTGGTGYGVLTTVVPWNDTSGGAIQQTYRIDTLSYQRNSTSGTTWSTWLQIEDSVSSQAKATAALNAANLNTTNVVATTIPYNAVLTNENQSIPTDVLGATKSVFVVATDIDTFRGSTRYAGAIGVVALKNAAGGAITSTGGTPTITKLDPTAGAKGWVSVSIPSGCVLSADDGYVDIPIVLNGVTYYKKLSWNKAKDGLNAKTISLSGPQTFSYDEYGTLKYPTNTTLTVAKQNTIGSSYTWTYGVNGAAPATTLSAVAGQVVFAGDTVQIYPTAAIWGTADNITIKATLDGVSDTTTLYKIQDGASGTTLLLETPDGNSFKDNSGAAKALNVKLMRNGEDVSGNATIRWYLNGVENVGLLNLKTMNVYPSDVASNLVIRIVATYLGTAYESSTVFLDLDDTYQVQILGEDKIKNSQGNVTLTARAFRGANEITSGFRLRWTDVGQVPAVVLLEGSNTVDDRALTCVLTPAQINGTIDILCELSVDTVEAELTGTETSYVPSYDSRAYATAMSVALS